MPSCWGVTGAKRQLPHQQWPPPPTPSAAGRNPTRCRSFPASSVDPACPSHPLPRRFLSLVSAPTSTGNLDLAPDYKRKVTAPVLKAGGPARSDQHGAGTSPADCKPSRGRDTSWHRSAPALLSLASPLHLASGRFTAHAPHPTRAPRRKQ